MKTKILYSAVAIASIALLGMAGQMDYDDELAEVRIYCESVESGKWPDYRDDIDCGVQQ